MRAASGEGRVTLSLVLFQATARWACRATVYKYCASLDTYSPDYHDRTYILVVNRVTGKV